jgi:hypothetical protein
MDPFGPSPDLYPRPHPASLDEDALLKQCSIGKGRGSGPGGQNRNKVETKVMLTHKPTGVAAHAAERRTAVENKRVALFRLRLNLATQVRCPVPRGDVRSDLWKSRAGPTGQIACNPRHQDFPAMLAEAMDMLASAKYEPDSAAVRLGVTMSQLVKLVKKHPPAFDVLNRARLEWNKHPLK